MTVEITLPYRQSSQSFSNRKSYHQAPKSEDCRIRRRTSVSAILDHEKLLQKIAKSGDKDAFASLFNHFAPRLKSMMLQKGTDPNTAEELAQEAMLTVWRKSGLFDPSKASASTWIYTIARNLRIDRFRKESRPELDPNDPALIPEQEIAADEKISLRQRTENVRNSMATLPDNQREVVYLSFVEGLTHQEIADKAGIPLGTVKSRLRLSFEKLRPILEKI